ncbi:L-threonylcarbamoyladenylate synthase [Paenibacillus glycinis]|uniref:Threonylcarbamoyl-AMP synthase n=1 Tax=Paenibacillus glycinis TaxID=2697035 RepID=A0ABW9XW85_9BACL|nr:L-threonylcarbamoyladenylate synthase [Paenibacillus glycinis]NBD26796.1 threonylcarbamoyl-AMP synthase [Paenibacillus glycinis]
MGKRVRDQAGTGRTSARRVVSRGGAYGIIEIKRSYSAEAGESKVNIPVRNTSLWSVEGRTPDAGRLRAAAELLKAGGTVAFPTETVYGLGADARSTPAVERIFEAKGRPSDNPLIVHIADRAELASLTLPLEPAGAGALAERLMDRFWPGPLTFVLPAKPGAVSPRVTAGLETVAVRMPAHPVALALIAQSGCPLAAPSANRSGRPSPTLASHVQGDLDGRIDGIVDGGAAGVGLESTVIEVVDGGTVRILRPGGVTAEALREAGAAVVYDAVAAPDGAADAGAVQAPRSPGMKYAHYAPQGQMQLVQGDPAAVTAWIGSSVREARAAGERTGVLAFAEHAAGYDADCVLVMGSLARLDTAAHGLYAALREFDARGVQRIWAETCPEQGIGHALMNRLAKAAGHAIVRV